jgi:hypothetical protein
MPLPKLNDLTPDQRERVGEAHEAWQRGYAFETAALELQEAHNPDMREAWERHVIPVLRAEHDKAEAEHLRIMRELGYEGK